MSKLYVAKSMNLSLAWAEVFFKFMEPGRSELAPAVITISKFDERSLPVQIPEIQRAVDAVNGQSCRTIASTIFPSSLWSPGIEDDAQRLYDRYDRVWPVVSKCRPNSKGVYFRRLTAFSPAGSANDLAPVNQLKHIIETYKQGNHRHSALQASIFDPTRDHTHSRQRGFPCLQQVAFGVSDGTLEVTGFYALQHHVPKAYGNYLGLCWLGRFMAKQMGLRLSQVTCIASCLKLPIGDGYSKQGLTPLKNMLKQVVDQHSKRAA
ncbi:MAG: thymidylate synthase [Terriglobia bacterium]